MQERAAAAACDVLRFRDCRCAWHAWSAGWNNGTQTKATAFPSILPKLIPRDTVRHGPEFGRSDLP